MGIMIQKQTCLKAYSNHRQAKVNTNYFEVLGTFQDIQYLNLMIIEQKEAN